MSCRRFARRVSRVFAALVVLLALAAPVGADSLLQNREADTDALPMAGLGSWSPLASPTVGPGMRRAHAGFFDAEGGRFVVFGGTRAGAGGQMDSVYLGDTWGYDFARGRWNEIRTGGRGPTPRFIFAFTHDTKRNELIIHGGYDGTFLGDTWVLALRRRSGAWRRLEPAGPGPSERDDHAAIYDPIGDRLVVFGGWSGHAYLNDLWALTLGDSPTWTRLEPATALPAPRRTPSAVYDPVERRMIVFGGYNGSGFGDTWALSLEGAPRWERLLEAGGPSPRWGQTLVWNTAGQVGILFGGVDDFAWHSDVWELGLSPAPQWTQRRADVSQPPGRLTHVSAYDPVNDRLLVHGGLQNIQYFADLWQLPFDSAGEAAGAPSGGVLAEDGAVELRGVPGEPRTWTLSFKLATGGEVVAALFDVRGRIVTTTRLGPYQAGRSEARFAAAGRMPSGVYFLRVSHGRHLLGTRRVLLLP